MSVTGPKEGDEFPQDTGDPEGAPSAESKGERDIPSEGPGAGRERRRISLSLSSLIMGLAIVVLVGALGAMSWLYVSERNNVEELTRKSENYQRAEETALSYAVGAAEINFQDLQAWKVKLVEGTAPNLKDKLTQAANEMEQILVPLEWNSTARPLAAKVRSDAGGAYVVDSFVSVLTKTSQAPEGLQSTATYSITIDSGQDWQITDVGGIDAVVGAR